MANEKVTQLPSVSAATLADIIYAVQGGVSVQETLQQVLNLGLSNTILNYAGNPNGNVAGSTYQFCVDTANNSLYICTTTGSASTAVWTLVGGNVNQPVNGGTGVSSPTAHTLPVAEGSSPFNFLGPLTNGQVLIGYTGSDPVPATLSAGAGINIVNTSGVITISSSGASPFAWTHVTGASQAMLSNNGYIIDDSSSQVTLTLPTSSAYGDQINIVGKSTDGWTVTYTTNQFIRVGSGTSTTTSGSITSTNGGDSIVLICTTPNLGWSAMGAPQSSGLTIV